MELQRKTSKLMTAELTKKLVDAELMHKYGTSLEINMSRDYQKNLDRKYQTLKAEFEKINKNSDEIITLDELQSFVHSYSPQTGIKYGDEYIKKLFQILDIDKDQKVTIKEFIMSYIQLEESLRIKKIKYSKFQAELELQLAKEKKGMLDNNGEVFNHNGISKEATLNITLLEARNLLSANFQGLSDPFVVFTLEGQKSKSAYKSNSLDPVWNENFVFQPSSKTTILNVEVWSKGNMYSGDTLLGRSEIFLENHTDQKKIVLNLELNTNNLSTKKSSNFFNTKNILNNINDLHQNENSDNLENTTNPSIHLSLQFIWNKLKYYTDNFNSVEKKIEGIKKHIEELNFYCENFKRPFGLILSGDLTSLLEKKLLENINDYSQIIDDHKTKTMTSPRHTNTRYTFTNKLQNVIKSTFRGTQIKWLVLSKPMIYLIVIFSCLSLYERPDFLNLSIGLVSFILLNTNKSKNALCYLRLFLNFLLCSLFYDLIWIWLYKHNFSALGFENRQHKTIYKAILFLLGLGNFICKIILSICIFIQISKSKNSQNSHILNNNNSRILTSNQKEDIPQKNSNFLGFGNNINEITNDRNNPFKTPTKVNQQLV